ncbi:MAG: hypothetical protein QOH26_852, partial [Actinomycetota bacterium]|nr:hypothetical protein [Actinomycetota bacterium]
MERGNVRRVVLTQGPRVRRGLLMTLVVVMPLIFLVDVLNDPVNTPKLAFLIAIVSLTLAVRAVEFACGRSGDGSGGLLVPALAVVLPLGIAWLLSPYRGWALLGQYNRYQGFLPYLVLAAFGLLAAEAFRGRALTLAWALLIAGAGAGAYALLETFGLSPFIWNAGGGAKTLGLTQASSTLGNPNFAGGFMCVVVPVGVGVWLTDRERRDRASVCLALTVVGWLVSFSQGAWLAGAAGLAVTLGIVLAPRLPWARVAGFAIAALLAVAGVGVVIAAMVGGPHDGDRTTADVRAWAWEAAIDMTADHPVVGRGPNSFAVEGIQHRTKDEGIQADYQTDDPHSVFFSYLTAAGVLGGLGFVILAGWIIRRALTVGSEAPLAAAFAGAAVAYLAQSLLSFDELSTRLALWTALAGLAATLPRHLDATIGSRVPAPRADDDHGPPTLSRVVALLAAAVVLVSGCWYAGTIMVADRHYLRGVRAAQDNLAEEAVDAFDAAIAVRPDHYYRANAGNRIGELGARRD